MLTVLTNNILNATRGKKMLVQYEMNKKEYLEFKRDSVKEMDEGIKQLRSGKSKEQVETGNKRKQMLGKVVSGVIMLVIFGKPIFMKLYRWYADRYMNDDE